MSRKTEVTPDSLAADVATQAAVVHAVRMAYGRLIAYLAARTRDIAACEDALSQAFASALETWPVKGVPERPEAWLLTAARNRLKDGYRRDKVRAEAMPTVMTLMDEAHSRDLPFPDERLKLMFVCAHPAIDESVRTPLMLQTVLGLASERIASVFLIKPATMAQRLSRAKAKIRDAGIAFEVPEVAELPARLTPLLAAIYAAYGLGWGDYAGDASEGSLSSEAMDLASTLHDLMPLTPELNGLLALIFYCEARKPARIRGSAYIALSDQDTSLWNWPLIHRANGLLNAAQPLRQFGRYQLEAAIQSVHIRRGVTSVTDWAEIVVLYEGLLHYAPSLASRTGYAAALTEAGRAADGLAVLDAMDGERMRDYQPFWAVRAHILARLGRKDEAHAAYERGIGLSRHNAQRDFLRGRQAKL